MIAQRKREEEKGQRITRSSSKRKKVQSHFHKVGILDSERKRKKTKKCVSSKKKKAQSDEESSFHPSDDQSHNSKSSSTILDNGSTIVNGSRAIDVEGEVVDHNSPSVPTEFQLQIENSEDDDMFGDSEADSASDHFDPLATIAEIVKKKRKEDSKFIKTCEKHRKTKSTKKITLPAPTEKTTTENKERSLTRSEKLENFLSQFNIPKYWVRVIPSFVIRENEMDIESASTKQSYLRMTSLCSKMIDIVLRTLCPGPGHRMFKKHLLQTMLEKIDTIKNLPFQRTKEEKLTSVIKTLCEWSNKSKKRTVERRVIRAILNESFLTHEIKSFRDGYGLIQGTGQAVQQARADAIDLSHGKKIKLKVIKRQFRKDSTISKCVKFILSDDNVASVSWGSKRILLQSCGELLVPKLTRKSPIKDMYSRYKDVVANDNEAIRSATFYKICNVLTSSDQAMLNSIDYVTCMLVNESCEILQDMIDKVVMNEHRDECSKYLTATKKFLKNQFKDIIKNDDDDCCFHGFTYALSRDLPTRENTNDNGCKFPFFL